MSRPAWARNDEDRQLVNAEEQHRQAALGQRRERLARLGADLEGPTLPEGTVPLDRTPRPDGLAVDTSIGSYALKRLSPLRARWPELVEFDERVRRLEQRQTDVNAQIAALKEQHRRAENEDRDALARWVAAPEGERPLPTAPGLEQRVNELAAERDALTLAQQHELDRKTEFVERHRKRLVREAGKARSAAVSKLQTALDKAEEAREEAADCVRAERFARKFPEFEANASDLRLDTAKGGRLPKAIPEFKGLAPATHLYQWLREDGAWLDAAIEAERAREEAPPDPRHQAIWTNTPEGQEALRREQERLRGGLRPRA